MAFWRAGSLFSSSTPSTTTTNNTIGQETVRYTKDSHSNLIFSQSMNEAFLVFDLQK
jgi:hypothetical protein